MAASRNRGWLRIHRRLWQLNPVGVGQDGLLQAMQGNAAGIRVVSAVRKRLPLLPPVVRHATRVRSKGRRMDSSAAFNEPKG